MRRLGSFPGEGTSQADRQGWGERPVDLGIGQHEDRAAELTCASLLRADIITHLKEFSPMFDLLRAEFSAEIALENARASSAERTTSSSELVSK